MALRTVECSLCLLARAAMGFEGLVIPVDPWLARLVADWLTCVRGLDLFVARLGKTPAFAMFTVERLIGPLAAGAMDALFID